MGDKLMYIPNVNSENCHFYILQLVVETFGHQTNQNSVEVPKVVSPTNKKTLLKNFGD